MSSLPRFGAMGFWLTALFVFAGVAFVDCACPVGWITTTPSSGTSKCFRLYEFRKTFSAAQKYCQSKGGYLARDTDAKTHQVLSTYMYNAGKANYGPSSFWIGLTDTNKALPWKWVGGSNLGGYNAWKNHKAPYNSKYRQDCVYISSRDKLGTWITNNYCYAIRAFVCQVDFNSAGVTATHIGKITCPQGWRAYQAGKVCLHFHYYSHSYTYARSYCKRQGGDLIKITDGKMAGFLDGIMRYHRADYYIGLTDIKTEGKFVWNDETTAATYTRWNSGEPNDYNHAEDCVIIKRSNYKWNDVTCSMEYRFICQRPPVSVPPQITTKGSTTPSEITIIPLKDSTQFNYGAINIKIIIDKRQQ